MRAPLLLLAVLLGTAGAAHAGCWAADVTQRSTDDGTPFQAPQHAPLRAALDTLNSLLRPNPGLHALPEVRLRMKREIWASAEPARLPRPAVLHAQGFGPKAWGPGDCELIAQADRLGARAGFSIFINQPTATLNRWKHDEQLTTWLAPPATPAFQGWPTYGECAVVSHQRRLPWVPVSQGEMLAFELREQQRRIEAHDRDNAQALQPYDPAPHEREAERLRVHSPQAADALLLAARQRKALEAASHAAIAKGRAHLVAEQAALRERQRQLSPEAAAAPYQMPGTHTVVRLDAGFPWDTRRLNQVQLLTVCAAQRERNPRYHPPMRDAVAALDFARLAALLTPQGDSP